MIVAMPAGSAQPKRRSTHGSWPTLWMFDGMFDGVFDGVLDGMVDGMLDGMFCVYFEHSIEHSIEHRSEQHQHASNMFALAIVDIRMQTGMPMVLTGAVVQELGFSEPFVKCSTYIAQALRDGSSTDSMLQWISTNLNQAAAEDAQLPRTLLDGVLDHVMSKFPTVPSGSSEDKQDAEDLLATFTPLLQRFTSDPSHRSHQLQCLFQVQQFCHKRKFPSGTSPHCTLLCAPPQTSER